MVTWRQIVYGIMALAVIFTVIAFIFLFRAQWFPWLRGEELNVTQQEKAKSNFEGFIANIEACHEKSGTACLCEGFPVWPGTFPLQSILTIKHVGKKVEIELSHRDKVLKNASIEGVRLWAMKADKERLVQSLWKNIIFKEEPPIFRQEGVGGRLMPEWFVVSRYLYKGTDGLYFIIGKEEVELDIPKCS